jgi:hypothetical protein
VPAPHPALAGLTQFESIRGGPALALQKAPSGVICTAGHSLVWPGHTSKVTLVACALDFRSVMPQLCCHFYFCN